MDLFRSKKRDTGSLGEIPSSLEKKHRGMSGSMDDLLDIDKEDQDTATDATESSDSDIEDGGSGKISRKQKMFAKKSIKREKKKEKEQRKKVEKNNISMDDFLRKQSEFKMWLYEEKSKNAGELSSPKLKSLFKHFVRNWNKRKLPQKYYRSLTCPDSPTTPLTPKKFNFLTDDETNKSPLAADGATTAADPAEVKEPAKSPFVTFGKTPPKVLRSRKLQLFAPSQDVALISVVPIGSPQVIPAKNKENTEVQKPDIYNVPKIKRKPVAGKATAEETADDPKPAVPYRVSVFPWAVNNKDGGATEADTSLEVCSTATPPHNKSPQTQVEDDSWPTPPSEIELNNCHGNTQNESPHVPPPPPPRSESLSAKRAPILSTSSDPDFPPPPPIASTYSDPYDKLPDPDFKPTRYISEYQEPVDSVVTVNSRTRPDQAAVVLNSLSSHTRDTSCGLDSKQSCEKREFSQDELEELYAKPMKRRKEVNQRTEKTAKVTEEVFESELYSEIMAHLNKNTKETANKSIDPDYATIDECMGKTDKPQVKESSDEVVDRNETAEKEEKTKSHTPTSSSEPHFAKLSKAKKRTVLAASSDKIYETYLSMGRNANPFKTKSLKEKTVSDEPGVLRKRFKSQPDISFSEGLQVHDNIDISKDTDTEPSTPRPFLSSFKPVDVNHKVSDGNCVFKNEIAKYKLSNRAKSYEDGLREINPPGTPTILATPSFDSLYAVTPLSKKSGSSQSLPTKTDSSESLSEMSISTSSSLSYAPDDQSGSMQSLHSNKSLPTVPEEIPEKDCDQPEHVNNQEQKDPMDRFKPSTAPLTPGKLSGGIDLSVYLLKPARKPENNSTPCPSIVEESEVETGSKTNDMVPSPTEPVKHDSQAGSKLLDTQSRLAIKDTLSGVKTKVDPSKAPSKETERRHTVQTVHDLKVSLAHKLPSTHSQVPAIGTIMSKSRKLKKSNEDVSGPNAKRVNTNEVTVEATKVVGVGDDKYLETDLDEALTDKARQPFKKSKSHSGFDQGASNVVTEIW